MADEREEQIRDRAYRIWQEEGEPEGREQEHWARAEQEQDAGAGETLIERTGDDLPFGEPADTGADDAPPQTIAAEPSAGGAPDTRIASASGAIEPPAGRPGKSTPGKARSKTTN